MNLFDKFIETATNFNVIMKTNEIFDLTFDEIYST